jgi:AcrR family transcriptional regulator
MSEVEHRRPRGRPSAASREQFLDAATRRFLASERVDVNAVCAELGLSRATVHRWFGSRDRVLGEVLVTLTLPFLGRIARESGGSGSSGLVDLFVRFARALSEDRAFRHFVDHEPAAARRILTSGDELVEPRVVEMLQSLIEAEMSSGYEPPADPDVVAYAIVRIAESFLYADGFHGDFSRLRAVYALLLGVDERGS